MIKKLLMSVFLLFGIFINAQSVYNFETENIAYQNLIGSTSLNNGIVWDDPQYSIPLGFTYKVGSVSINTIHIYEDGMGGALATNQNGGGSDVGLLFPIAQDLVDRGFGTSTSLSNISYKTEGSVGNRVTIIEWNNAGFFDDLSQNDFINIQVWFYEGTNIMEYRYGPSRVDNPVDSYEEYPGPLVAFAPRINSNTGIAIETAYLFEGNPENPTVLVFQPGEELNGDSLVGTIPTGTIYRFIPQSLSVEDFSQNDFQIYPNPASEYLHIKTQLSNYNCSIYNSLGQKVNATLSENKIDISNLSNGIYFLKIETETGAATKKFIKQS